MKKTLLILIFIYAGHLYSQQIKVVRDFGLWTGFSFEEKVFSDYYLTLENQFRTFNNGYKLDDYLFNAKLQYSINKRFALSGAIRYTYDLKRINSAEHNIRYNFDIEYKKGIAKKTKLRYRLRYQKEFVNVHLHINVFFSNRVQKIYTSAIRHRIKLNFKHNPKNNIYASFEIFRLIEVFREPYFGKYRCLLGNKMNAFDVAIGFENELNSNYPYKFLFLKTVYTLTK